MSVIIINGIGRIYIYIIEIVSTYLNRMTSAKTVFEHSNKYACKNLLENIKLLFEHFTTPNYIYPLE